MGHPEIENKSPFCFEPLFMANENGAPLFVGVIKATFVIGADETPTIAPEQVPVNVTGESWGDPAVTSLKYEPEVAFTKRSTDVALIGHAYAQKAKQSQIDVRLAVGEKINKTVRVFGDRVWIRRVGVVTMSEPKQFETIPLVYERAFGGWDSSTPDPMQSKFEPRNPVGVGFKRRSFEEGMPLPNLEDPRRSIQVYGDTPAPAGFGFLSPHWQPRVTFAGTYDARWESERAPRLPTDFDSRFFNAASPGLIAPEYLRGDEPVLLENASPHGRLAFRLPGVAAPKIQLKTQRGAVHLLSTALDTVILNTDENLLFLLWRANCVVPDGPLSVAELRVDCS